MLRGGVEFLLDVFGLRVCRWGVGATMAELVPIDAPSAWGLKTHGLMRDVPLHGGEDQRVHRPELLETEVSMWT